MDASSRWAARQRPLGPLGVGPTTVSTLTPDAGQRARFTEAPSRAALVKAAMSSPVEHRDRIKLARALTGEPLNLARHRLPRDSDRPVIPDAEPQQASLEIVERERRHPRAVAEKGLRPSV